MCFCCKFICRKSSCCLHHRLRMKPARPQMAYRRSNCGIAVGRGGDAFFLLCVGQPNGLGVVQGEAGVFMHVHVSIFSWKYCKQCYWFLNFNYTVITLDVAARKILIDLFYSLFMVCWELPASRCRWLCRG